MSARSMGKAQAVGDRALRAILSVFWFDTLSYAAF